MLRRSTVWQRRILAGGVSGLLFFSAARARSETTAEKREERWARQHVDLDQLPVAYTLPHGKLTLGGSVSRTPAGFPADEYRLYPALAYGVTDRTELDLGVTGAQRLGPGGEATFYTLGLQHVLGSGAGKRSTVSVGAYGFFGPDAQGGGALYGVASRQLTAHPYPRGVFAHLGLELQGFSADDSSVAPRPFLGAEYVLTHRLRFTAEFRLRMPWESANLYSLRSVVMVTRRFGLSLGVRNNGYRTHPFVGIRIE
jgi:hypothetical protein